MKLYTMYANRDDGTSFYRGLGVVSMFDKITSNIKIKEGRTASWSSLIGKDLVFFQRPFLKDHKEAIKICHINKIPVIIDYDDLVSEIPDDNPFHAYYAPQNYTIHFQDILNMADGIIFSTNYLAERLKKTKLLNHDRYTIINNGLNDYLFKPDNNFSNYKKLVVWRGSATHSVDFAQYISSVEKIISDNQDFSFLFMQYLPSKKLLSKPNVGYIPQQDIILYMDYIKKINPSICYCPLKKMPFNLSKSNIAKIEATYAGAVSLNMDFPEWGWSGNKKYMFTCPSDFEIKFNNLLDMVRIKDPEIEKEYRFNFNCLKKNYLLSNLNKKRIEYIENVSNSADLSIHDTRKISIQRATDEE